MAFLVGVVEEYLGDHLVFEISPHSVELDELGDLLVRCVKNMWAVGLEHDAVQPLGTGVAADLPATLEDMHGASPVVEHPCRGATGPARAYHGDPTRGAHGMPPGDRERLPSSVTAAQWNVLVGISGKAAKFMRQLQTSQARALLSFLGWAARIDTAAESPPLLESARPVAAFNANPG
ncbi:hypothetical protein [Streptomyces sp. B6B3]|uniref:hypothetical protein n=1 Tax=Streptomyces sp. B6B3 TaxID=3153570 RepID=UPI00325C85A9